MRTDTERYHELLGALALATDLSFEYPEGLPDDLHSLVRKVWGLRERVQVVGMQPKIREYLALFKEAEVIYNSDASWETKFKLIFSDEISVRMGELFRQNYYDPDTTYEEDLSAWFRAQEEQAAELALLGELE